MCGIFHHILFLWMWSIHQRTQHHPTPPPPPAKWPEFDSSGPGSMLVLKGRPYLTLDPRGKQSVLIGSDALWASHSHVAFIVLWFLCSQLVECIMDSFSTSVVRIMCPSFTLLGWCVTVWVSLWWTILVSYLTMVYNSLLCCRICWYSFEGLCVGRSLLHVGLKMTLNSQSRCSTFPVLITSLCKPHLWGWGAGIGRGAFVCDSPTPRKLGM